MKNSNRISNKIKENEVFNDKSTFLDDIEKIRREKKILYFSQIQGRCIFDATGKKIGKLFDLAISSGKVFPEVSHLIFKHNREQISIEWNNILSFDEKIILKEAFAIVAKGKVLDGDVMIANNILDKQVVDVRGLKVIRVNDVALTFIESKLAVISIDVGSRALFRRIGFGHLADKLNFLYDKPLPWQTIEPITRSLDKIHLKVPCAKVSDLHSVDVAGLFNELSIHERKIFLRSMKPDKAADVIMNCHPAVRHSIVKSLSNKKLALIIENIPVKNSASFISNLDSERQNIILGSLNNDLALKLQELLSFEPNSVARFLNHDFTTEKNNCSVKNCLHKIKLLKKKPDNLHYIYVVNSKDSLIGAVSLKNLLTAKSNSKIENLIDKKLIFCEMNDSLDYAKHLLSKYQLLSIPVLDISGKIRGNISLHDIISESESHKKHDFIKKELGIKKTY